MSYGAPARTPARRARVTALALAIVSAAFVGFLVDRSPTTADDLRAVPRVMRGTPQPPAPPPPGAALGRGPHGRLPRDQLRALGEADGVLPEGVTVFDDRYPAVTKLDPALLAALHQAGARAARAGVRLHVESGWRSASYQEQLLREAVSEHGSEAEAARWVAPPDRSAHVLGKAVDIGPAAAATWLSEHGAELGLCQIYRNETWHYELRPEAVDHGCPRMYADPTSDPRMQP
jgi:D-alanyl-D-alanine carboxypeptidase